MRNRNGEPMPIRLISSNTTRMPVDPAKPGKEIILFDGSVRSRSGVVPRFGPLTLRKAQGHAGALIFSAIDFDGAAIITHDTI